MSKKIQRITVTVAVITSFITTFTGSALNLSIPDIGEEFHVSAGFVGWLITGYTLAVAAFSVPMGRIADITCRKKVLVTGIVIFTLCCAGAFFTPSMVILLIIRMIQGMGASMIFSTNTAVLLSAFPGNMRGRVIGYSLAATYVGLSSGPVVGGFLNHYLGWRSIFAVTGILALAAFFMAALKLPKDEREQEGGSFDTKGSALYLIFVLMFMYGLSETGKGWMPVFVAAGGVIFAVLFVRHEARTEVPVVKVKLFRENKGYAFSNLAALLNYAATFAISYLISIYLQVIMGYSSQTAGLIMISQPLIMAVLSPVMGRISDRFSPFGLSSVGMGFCAVGTAFFIFVGKDTSLWVIICALVITGLGFAFFSSPNTNAVMSCVEKEDYGVASSVLATMRSIGHTMSMVIVTVVVTGYMGSVSLNDAEPENLIDVVNVSFVIFTAICLTGVFISLKRK